MIDLCTLGTGGSLPLPERGLASLYVRFGAHALLVDCGENTQTAIRRLGGGFRCIDGLLLTHYHGDHCSGLPGFLLSLGKAGRTDPFHIYGCTGLRRIVEGLCVIVPQLPYPVLLHEFEKPEQFSIIGLTVTPFRLNHGIPCYGYLFQLPRAGRFSVERAESLRIPKPMWRLLQHGESVTVDDRIITPNKVMEAPRQGISFLYATDTRPVPSIVDAGRGTDLMILEGMYGDEKKRPQALRNKHMLFEEAAELAKAAQTKRLLLTHYSTSVDDPKEYLPLARRIFESTDCAEDLSCLTLRYPSDPA